MKNLLVGIVLFFAVLPVTVGASVSLVSCNVPPAVAANTIAAAQAAAQTATTLVSDAQAAWPAVKALLPSDKQAAAQDAFDKAVFTANHTLLALNDAITAAIAADNPTFDFTAFLSALGDAAMQVVTLLQGFHVLPATPSVAASAAPLNVALADMNRAALALKTSKTAPASSK